MSTKVKITQERLFLIFLVFCVSLIIGHLKAENQFINFQPNETPMARMAETAGY